MLVFSADMVCRILHLLNVSSWAFTGNVQAHPLLVQYGIKLPGKPLKNIDKVLVYLLAGQG